MHRILVAAVLAAALPAAALAQGTTAAKPPVTKPKAAQSNAPAAGGSAMAAHKATVKTKSGKTITYDCSKKGNMNKKACKG